MIDWTKKAEKSEKEKEFDEWCARYAAFFGKRYGIQMFAPGTLDDCIQEIQNCIITNTPQKFPEIDPAELNGIVI